MKKILLTTVLVITIGFINAQNSSGYFGKRFVAGYQFQVAPILVEGMKFGKKHFFTLDYALKDRYSIGLKIGRYNNSINEDILNPNYNYQNSLVADYNNFPVSYKDGSIRLKTTQITISNKFFKSKHGSIAPYGRYTLLNIGLLNSNVDVSDLELYYIDDLRFYNEIDLSTYSQTYTDIILEYGWGNQKILFDNFVLGYGIDFSFPVNSYIGSLRESRNLKATLMRIAQRRSYLIHSCDIFIEARYLF